MKYKAAVFDLDGVIVDTAKYHYLAWKRLADELGIRFTPEDNEQLKGVSRMKSLDILLELGGKRLSAEEKGILAGRKNAWYVEYINRIRPDELLPGAEDFLKRLRSCGVRTALGTASRNTPLILDKLGISGLFDAVVDGNRVSRAKPDPQVFTLAAEMLGVSNRECVVFEDAISGIEAARAAGMVAVGVGSPQVLINADYVISGFLGADFTSLVDRFFFQEWHCL